MFNVPVLAMVSPPPRSPPDQFIVEFTVSGPLPLIAPAEKLKLLTVVGELTVTATPLASTALSAAPGTRLGDQLAAVFQLPALAFVHVIVAAWLVAATPP